MSVSAVGPFDANASRHVRELSQGIDCAHCARSNELARSGLSAEKAVEVMGLRKSLTVGAHAHHGGIEFEKSLLKKQNDRVSGPPYPMLSALLRREFNKHHYSIDSIQVLDIGSAKTKSDYQLKHRDTMRAVGSNWQATDELVVVLNPYLRLVQQSHIDWIRPDLLIRLPGLAGFLVCEIKGFLHVQEDDKASDVGRAIQQCAIGAHALIRNMAEQGITNMQNLTGTSHYIAIICRAIGQFATMKMLDVSAQIRHVGEKLTELYSQLRSIELDPRLEPKIALGQLLDSWSASYSGGCHGQCSLSDYCGEEARNKGDLRSVLRSLPTNKKLTWQDVTFLQSPPVKMKADSPDRASTPTDSACRSAIVVEPSEILFKSPGSGLDLQAYLLWLNSSQNRSSTGEGHE